MVSQLTPNLEVQGSNPYLPSLYMYICIYIYLSSHRTSVRRMSSVTGAGLPSDAGVSLASDAAGSPAPSPVRFWLAKTLYE